MNRIHLYHLILILQACIASATIIYDARNCAEIRRYHGIDPFGTFNIRRDDGSVVKIMCESVADNTWTLLFNHDISTGEKWWDRVELDESLDPEVLESGRDARDPRYHNADDLSGMDVPDMYSILNETEFFRCQSDQTFTYRMRWSGGDVPQGDVYQNTWSQTSNPVTTFRDEGDGLPDNYASWGPHALHWTGRDWHGLERTSSTNTLGMFSFIDGSSGPDKTHWWWYAIGQNRGYGTRKLIAGPSVFDHTTDCANADGTNCLYVSGLDYLVSQVSLWVKGCDDDHDGCEAYRVESSCSGDTSCVWLAALDVCESSCAGHAGDATACDENDMCIFQASTNECLNRCEHIYDTESACTGDAVCEWTDATGCTELCGFYASETTCDEESYGSCRWHAASSTCVTSCGHPSRATQSECESASECRWTNDDGCIEECGFMHTEETPCEADPHGCRWLVLDDGTDRAECAPVCRAAYGSESLCNNDDACMWLPSLNACGPSCFKKHGSDATACDADDHCIFHHDSGDCHDRCGVLYGDFDTCDDDGWCHWLSSGEGCVDDCTMHGSVATSCEADGHCIFHVDSSHCEFKCEHLYGDLSDCTDDPWCEWSNATEGCIESCGFHESETTCDGAPSGSCRWDASTDTCVKSCGHPSRAIERECESASECRWTGDDGCIETCEFMHTEETPCEADLHGCRWLVLDEGGGSAQCAPDCRATHASESPCNDDDACVWLPSLNACVQSCFDKYGSHTPACDADDLCVVHHDSFECHDRCDVLYDDVATCDNDGWCQWVSGEGCVANCMFHGSDAAACADASQCIFHVDYNHCNYKCEVLYDEPDRCTRDRWCEWINATEHCTESCGFHESETTCDGDSSGSCRWYTSSNTCVKRCDHPSRSAERECESASECRWTNSDDGCIETCEFMHTEETPCEADAHGCRWLDEGSGSGQCVPTCRAAHGSESSCNDDDACVWYPAWHLCEQSCFDKYGSDAAACKADDHCIFNQHLDNEHLDECHDTCGAKHNDVDTCETDSSCHWVSGDGCLDDCTVHGSDETACGENSLCIFLIDSNSCENTCGVLYGDESACTEDPFCEWNNATEGCTESCGFYESPVRCDGECRWNATSDTCVESCGRMHSTDAACTGDAECMWRVGNGAGEADECVPNCHILFHVETECASDASCRWVDHACEEACGLAHVTESTCENDAHGCRWDDDVCVPDCESAHGTASSCASDASCRWHASSNTCIDSCGRMHGTEVKCTNDAECRWRVGNGAGVADECVPNCRSSYDVETECASDASCRWVDDTCEEACGLAHITKPNCENDAHGCRWDNDTVCVPDCGASHKVESSCSGDASCRWLRVTTTCTETCRLSYDAETPCNGDAECAWVVNATVPYCDNVDDNADQASSSSDSSDGGFEWWWWLIPLIALCLICCCCFLFCFCCKRSEKKAGDLEGQTLEITHQDTIQI